MLYFFFLNLFLLARTSSTMLNRSGERGILVLFLNLEESVQTFTMKYGVSYGIFIDALYYIEEIPFYS